MIHKTLVIKKRCCLYVELRVALLGVFVAFRWDTGSFRITYYVKRTWGSKSRASRTRVRWVIRLVT